MGRYNNYHKHSHKSNIFTPDTHIKNESYAKRAKELGHTTLFSTEHGWSGDQFEVYDLANKYDLKPINAMEGYIVANPLEKDNSNYHIVIIPKTDKARRKLNKISSRANTEGYYYKPRIFIDDLLKCDKDDYYITNACCGGILKNKDSFENIFIPLYNHFKNNMLLEVQTHNSKSQRTINTIALKLKEELGLRLIHANDSHYIYPEDSVDRLEFLKGKGLNYGEEDEYILDYPDYDTIVERYKLQGILSDDEIKEALETTLIFDDINNIELNKNIKMPNIYKDLTVDERINKLKEIVSTNFEKIIKEDNITDEELPKYIKSIQEEMNVIEETKSIHAMDYFLFNERLVKKAVDEYNGVLTTSSRGSAGAFYINRLLNITQLDRNRSKIPLYYERFMSSARLLGDNPPYTSSLPDCDFNVSDPQPFINASLDLLGENGCRWMMAFGTMQEGEAFRNTCRSKGIPFDEFNEVAKNIDDYRENEYWKPIIEYANRFVGVIVSCSPHPCSNILFDGDLEEELGVIKIGDVYCCPITSGEADEWKYLKNDYLTVSTVAITKEVFDMIGIPRMSLVELENALDDKVWDIYENGLTCTINQIDSDSATEMMKRYKAKNISELAIFTGVIRPNFNDYREDFLSRKPFSNGIKEMDDMFAATSGYICFQENLMQWFEWLGIPPNKSIGLIKKISKKKIKESDFKNLEETLISNWIKYGYTIDKFNEIWVKLQSMMNYSYNSPHALSMAYDSLYGAYQKSHYPLEYYSIVLEKYKGDEKRTKRLTEELKYFNIEILPPKYRYSKSNYMPDKENNRIYKGVGSIKYLNEECSNGLYELRDNEYNNFIDLLFDIKDKVKCNTRQMEILIKLDYFSEFGKSEKLMKTYELFEEIYGKKTLKFDKWDKFFVTILNSYNMGDKITEKQISGINVKNIMYNVFENIPDKDISIVDKIKTELDYLGYITYTDKTYNSLVCVVTEIKKSQYSIFVTLYQLNSGKSTTIKVDKRFYNNKPLEQYDVITIGEMAEKERKTKDENGKWIGTGEYYNMLMSYGKVVLDDEVEVDEY